MGGSVTGRVCQPQRIAVSSRADAISQRPCELEPATAGAVRRADPAGAGELSRTRAYRGVVASVVGLGHLYHLEHHLYPSVPHGNWPELARRLDPYLERAGVRPVRLWF